VREEDALKARNLIREYRRPPEDETAEFEVSKDLQDKKDLRDKKD
jgi:hypothetical protein